MNLPSTFVVSNEFTRIVFTYDVLVVIVPAMFSCGELEARAPKTAHTHRNFVKRENFLAYSLLGILAGV